MVSDLSRPVSVISPFPDLHACGLWLCLTIDPLMMHSRHLI